MFKTNCKITIEKQTDYEIEFGNVLHEKCWEYANKHNVDSILKFFCDDGDGNTFCSCPICNSHNIGIYGTSDEITEIWCYDCGASHEPRTTFDWLTDIYDEKEMYKLIGVIDIIDYIDGER